MKRIVWITAFVVSISSLFMSPNYYQIHATSENKRPNFLIIVADDLGFSDIEPFGSETSTPNLIELAKDGKLLTNFHVLPACSPTRSILLTGVDNHLNGLGAMYEVIAPNQRGAQGYETYLNDEVISIADILNESGYHTILSGKWHLSNQHPSQPINGEYMSEPGTKGFEKTFTLLGGHASHFNSSKACESCRTPIFLKDGSIVQRPGNVYSSNLFTDELINFIKDSRTEDSNPLFMYLAFQVAHLPFDAPAETLLEHEDKYKQGWDVLRQERFDRQKEIGLWPGSMQLKEWFPPQNKWNNSTEGEQSSWSEAMEKRAAMIDNMDYNIGRILDYLKEIGEYDNTFILFTSDNGGSNPSARTNSVSVTPFSGFKATMYEGGIRSSMIVKEPNQIGNGQIIRAFTHILDLTPTFLDYADVQHPSSETSAPFFLRMYRGSSSPAESVDYFKPTGKSIKPLLDGSRSEVHSILDNPVSQELFGNSAVFYGNFKAVRHIPPAGTGEWELFDLSDDPMETTNLAAEYPYVLRLLTNSYYEYAETVGVVPPEKGGIPIYLFGSLPSYHNYTSFK